MPPVPMHPPELVSRARDMYRAGARIKDICAATGMAVGTLYYHLDGLSLPGLVVPRLPRRRDVAGTALKPLPSRGRQKLAARLFRAAEQQARKIELRLPIGHQNREDRALDLQALRELTRILRDLAVVEDSAGRSGGRGQGGGFEQEQALAVKGRAVVVTRMRRG